MTETTTETRPEPARMEPAAPAPRIAIGARFRRHADTPYWTVVGLRYQPEPPSETDLYEDGPDAEWTGQHWEYRLVRWEGYRDPKVDCCDQWQEWGWVAEAELLAGYQWDAETPAAPAAPDPDEPTDAERAELLGGETNWDGVSW